MRVDPARDVRHDLLHAAVVEQIVKVDEQTLVVRPAAAAQIDGVHGQARAVSWLATQA